MIGNISRKKTKIRLYTYGDWCIYALNIALFNEDFHCFEAKGLDLSFRERFASLELLDLAV